MRKSVNTYRGILLTLLVLIPCRGAGAAEKASALAYEWAESFGATYSQINRRLGRPRTVVIKREKNRYRPGANDTIWQLAYPGLELEVHRLPASVKTAESPYSILLVNVRSARYRMRHGLNVGTPVREVLRVLGRSTRQSATLVRYDWNGGGEVVADPAAGDVGGIRFRLKNGRVASIEYDHFLD